MKKKLWVGVLSTGLLITSLISIPFSNVKAESETSIPSQIQNLQAQLGEIKELVTGLVSTKDDVEALNKLVNQQKNAFSEQEIRIDSMTKQIEDLKTTPPTVDTALPEERLAYEGTTGKIPVYLNEKIDGIYYPAPNQVIEVFDPRKPEDKLIGVTDYKGKVVFTVRTNTTYQIVYRGNEKYRPQVASDYGKEGNNISTIYMNTLAW